MEQIEQVQRIEESEYFNNTPMQPIDKIVDFEEGDRKLLRRVVPDEISVTFFSRGKVRIGEEPSYIMVNKGKNEWYYVHMAAPDEYFKCDQMDSLLICLRKRVRLQGLTKR